MPLPSKSFLRGSDYHSNKLQAVPAQPYLRLTRHEPSRLLSVLVVHGLFISLEKK